MALPNNCPLCDALAEAQSVITPHVYGDTEQRRAFFQCSKCDVRYLYPLLAVDQEAEFYKKEFENFMTSRSGDQNRWEDAETHVSSSEETRLRRMKYLPTLQDQSHILEVGCSSGFMLYPMRDAGHTCVGVEPSGLFNEYLQSRGIESYNSVNQLPKEVAKAGFDLIMHFFVLEHISQPVDFLQSQIELLKPGGTIVFEVPNAADPLYSVYDIPEFERFYWSIAHPWYFSQKSLRFLLEKLPFENQIRLDQRYDLSNHIVWARDGRPGGQGRFTKKFGEKLERSYRQLLIESGHCDTLIGIVRKDDN
jgi:SAM-dependent methyltransferase